MGGSVPQKKDLRVSYLGQVALRCYVPKRFDGAKIQCYSRTMTYARDDIQSLQIEIPNFYVATVDAPANGAETGTGSIMSCTASVEYPAGTYQQAKFSSAASGSVPSGSRLRSDPMIIAIPYGAQFWLHAWYSNANGVVYDDTWEPSAGDRFAYGASVPDYTMGGVAAVSTTLHFTPCAVVSQTKRQSVIIFGDSNARGVAGVNNDGGDSGVIAPSIGPVAAYINAGIGGDSAQFFVASHAQRVLLADYCTDIVVNYGTNDIAASRTAVQILADLNTIIGLFPTKRVWVCTVPPRTTSTDSFATTTNQTVLATEGVRITLINTIRYVNVATALPGVAGLFDICSAIESGYNSGKWSTGPNQFKCTGDGLHASAQGISLIKWRNIINPALFCIRG
jgi:lysophospholipase L1-like esterase